MDGSFDGSWWSYVLVVLAAATPAIEVLVVVPAAIVAGMAPVPVTILAVAGNTATLAVAVLAGDRLLAAWRRRRAGRRGAAGDHAAADDTAGDAARDDARGRDAAAGDPRGRRAALDDPAGDAEPSRRAERARRLARRYGVPGLALLAPITTGTHIAALAALAIGGGRARVLVALTLGLTGWAVVATVAATPGASLFQ
jgi:Ca2+/H+ antiporter, TMEM165/GDT1 family